MATSSRHRAVGIASRVAATPAGRYAASPAHLAGCAAAAAALAACVADYRTRPELLLAMVVAYAAVAVLVTVAVRSRRRGDPAGRPVAVPEDPRRVEELLYLNVRRVNDSLALLRKSLAGERKVTGGTTIDGGLEVKADLMGAGISGSQKRSVRQEIEEVHHAGEEQRYRALYDAIGVRPPPDVSPATLQRQTFWEFALTEVRTVEESGADAAYALGRVEGTSLRVWLRLDPEWRREPPEEFHGDLTVVARAAPQPLPDQLVEPLRAEGDHPDWRLRPLAVLR